MKRNGLIFILLTGLGAYHAYSFLHPDFHLPVPGKKRKEPDVTSRIDASWRVLGYPGYIAKFFVGQWPPALFVARNRVYLRTELPFQRKEVLNERFAGLRKEIPRVAAYYKKHGVTLVLLPVPTKISQEIGDSQEAREVVQEISSWAPAETVDLDSALRYADSTRDRYAPFDSHWTSYGITVAVEAIVKNLRARGIAVDPYRATLVRTTEVGEMTYDLQEMMQLPRLFMKAYSPISFREELIRLDSKVARPPKGRLILAGSSYAKRLYDSEYGIGNQLARVLHRQVLDRSYPAHTMNYSFVLLQAEKVKMAPGDILLWEFPVRNPLPPGEDVILLPSS